MNYNGTNVSRIHRNKKKATQVKVILGRVSIQKYKSTSRNIAMEGIELHYNRWLVDIRRGVRGDAPSQ